MKKVLILIVIAMLAVPLFAGGEGVLIDFSLLAADITIGEGDRPNQNQRTLMDFSHVTGGTAFSDRHRDAMRTSLAIENWEVTLASSARFPTNMANSFTREAASRQFGTVMGVRVHFPTEPHNSWAMIRPPFEIPAFEMTEVDADGTVTRTQNGFTSGPSRFESSGDGEPAFGVIKNVAVIREIMVRFYGLNFPHRLSVILIDSQGNERTHNMGHMRHDGWISAVWVNPAYMQEVRNRDLRLMPLYPFNTPFTKFGGFLIQRDAAHIGGDFVTYFKDVSIIYDRATLDQDRDIDDEAVWGIIQQREEARKTWEMERFGHDQILRFLEQERQATALPFGHPDREQQ
ncbi:MAG: flagellar filament outer layer protein FlaA [Treponema sp.]|nr:flagellar filament outer layer protein FlaA [Treponema sp.]